MAEAPKEEVKKEEENDKKLIVISGITSGIGAGMLRKFMKMGYIVAGFGRRKENILKLRKELSIKDELLISCIDITIEKDVKEWNDKIINKYGTPYIIIHNAGSVIGCNKDSWELDINDVMTSYKIMVIGSILLIKSFIPLMRVQNEGMFINISSWAGENGYAGGSPYCSSKHGIEGLTKCLAKELIDLNPENKILTCCLSPGFVNTEMLKGSFAETCAKQQNIENGDEWAEKTCQWILDLNNKKDLYHGKSIGPPLEKQSMKKYCDFFKVYGVEMDYNQYIHQPKE